MAGEREKRRERRYDYFSSVEFTLAEADEQVLEGVAVNISASGLCLCAFKPIMKGQEIMIKNLLPIPHLRMTVQWTKGFMTGLWAK